MADKPVRISKQAAEDLDGIWDYSAARWGPQQADRYNLGLQRSLKTIASMPEIAREHVDFDPPVRIYPSAEHLIVYLAALDHIFILRVLSGRQDWRAILASAE